MKPRVLFTAQIPPDHLAPLEGVAEIVMGPPGGELMPRAEAARLYEALLSQAGDATDRMRRALRDADTDELRRVSHGLKGAALNLGLRALADAADRLSGSAPNTNAGQLALALQRFDETLAATRALCASEPALAPG